MDNTINTSFLPHNDPETALAIYRDAHVTMKRREFGYADTLRSNIGPPDTNLVLYPPTADPGITEDEGRTILEMMAKGTFASLMLAAPDVDAAFERVQAKVQECGGEVMQEPTDQDWGSRDCAFRDPA